MKNVINKYVNEFQNQKSHFIVNNGFPKSQI
jgi:hypothetical protein